MRSFLLASLLLLSFVPGQARSRFNSPKSVPVAADGTAPGELASALMGQGGYVSGAKEVVVPLVAVAFETAAKASVTRSSGGGATIKSKSLETHLVIDPKVLQAIADQLQAIIEQDLAAQHFTVLPANSVDHEPRVAGITKAGRINVETGDNFMSGFAGNGTYNRWFTAGNRPLFGTGAQGACAETSALIRTAREIKKTLLFFRFKVAYIDIDAKNGPIFSDVKGRNLLHIASADMCVFTPAHTLGSIVQLKANLTAGGDYVKAVEDLPADQSQWKALNYGAALDSLLNGSIATTSQSKAGGRYAIVADPVRYEADSLLLLRAASKQFAQALRKAQ